MCSVPGAGRVASPILSDKTGGSGLTPSPSSSSAPSFGFSPSLPETDSLAYGSTGAFGAAGAAAPSAGAAASLAGAAAGAAGAASSPSSPSTLRNALNFPWSSALMLTPILR